MKNAHPAAFGALLILAVGSPALAANDFRDVAIISATINLVLENEPTGVEVKWSNPDTGNKGFVVADRTYYLDPRTPCRAYRRSMLDSSGRTLVVSGTGCRKPDGRWELDEESTAKPASESATRTASRPPRSSIGGSPTSDPRPEPPAPVTRERSGASRSGFPAPNPEPGAAPDTRPTAPSAPTVLTKPLPTASPPDDVEPPAERSVARSGPPREPDLSRRPQPAPPQPTPKKTAAKTEAPKTQAVPKQAEPEPTIAVSLPSKSEG